MSAAVNASPQHLALLAQPHTRLPAPSSWAEVDRPRTPRPMAVRVELVDGTVAAYTRAYSASMDAYADALATYGDADVRAISVEPQA